ncbi:hypothetical protein Tco_0586349 [Tanacetum coccineum]
MVAVEVPHSLEYRDGQLKVAPVLEVENFTNWKKRFMCHIIESSLGFSESATSTSSSKIMTSSLEHFNVVTRNCDAVSTNCVPYLDHLRVELQSCPVSSQIKSKSHVFPSNAFQMLK